MRRRAEEIEALVKGYRASGLTRGEYCERVGIAVGTLDYYRRRQGKGQRLVRVRLNSQPEPAGGFTLVLGNGRRIESGWGFGDTELARLIRVAEAE